MSRYGTHHVIGSYEPTYNSIEEAKKAVREKIEKLKKEIEKGVNKFPFFGNSQKDMIIKRYKLTGLEDILVQISTDQLDANSFKTALEKHPHLKAGGWTNFDVQKCKFSSECEYIIDGIEDLLNKNSSPPTKSTQLSKT